MNSVVRFVLSNPNSSECALFAFVVVLLWSAERFATAQSASEKIRHTLINVLYMSALLPIQLLTIALCMGVAQWTTVSHWGLVYLLPHADSPFVKFGVMFFALDFLDYVYHFLAHQFRPLWRLHSLHHSDRSVDVSTTFRENPAETLVRVCFLLLWVLVCGASPEVLVLRQTVETFANVSQHTTFRLPVLSARILGWLFVTSNLHHAHHHWQRPGTNCNYGDVFSIWDRVFRTYIDIQTDEVVFGLDSHTDRNPDEALMRLLSVITSAGWYAASAKYLARVAQRPFGFRRRLTTQGSDDLVISCRARRASIRRRHSSPPRSSSCGVRWRFPPATAGSVYSGVPSQL